MTILRAPLSAAKHFYLNRLGYHTDRKLVVFESDDWGSIRMPSREVFDRLDAEGDGVRSAFLRNDALEREEDLRELFALLREFRGGDGRHPCITANFAMANPDFARIDPAAGVYAYERFSETYARLYGPDNPMLALIGEGIDAHLFKPQLHAREHLNVARWMRDLAAGKPDTCQAFSLGTLDVQASITQATKYGYMDALNYDTPAERIALASIIREAADLFADTFGYRSTTFIASCFIWSPKLEADLADAGIRMLQTSFFQLNCPGIGTAHPRKIPHYTGQRNRYGQRYSVRNCEYEPVYDHDIEKRVSRCLREIERAFAAQKPAVVDTHRVNYIGAIHPDNARIGREGLHLLLTRLLQAHPEVEFLSSDELCAEMLQAK